MPTAWEQFSKGLADAVSDIREKVVEEPMWGRSLNSGGDGAIWQPDKQEDKSAFGSISRTKEINHEPEPTDLLSKMQKEQGMDR